MNFSLTTALAAYLVVAAFMAACLVFGLTMIWLLSFLFDHFGYWYTGALIVSLLALPVAVWFGLERNGQ